MTLKLISQLTQVFFILLNSEAPCCYCSYCQSCSPSRSGQVRLRPWPNMTFITKLATASAGCSASSSANTWHALSVTLPPSFRPTNPNNLQQTRQQWPRSTSSLHPADPRMAGNNHLRKESLVRLCVEMTLLGDVASKWQWRSVRITAAMKSAWDLW